MSNKITFADLQAIAIDSRLLPPMQDGSRKITTDRKRTTTAKRNTRALKQARMIKAGV